MGARTLSRLLQQAAEHCQSPSEFRVEVTRQVTLLMKFRPAAVIPVLELMRLRDWDLWAHLPLAELFWSLEVTEGD